MPPKINHWVPQPMVNLRPAPTTNARSPCLRTSPDVCQKSIPAKMRRDHDKAENEFGKFLPQERRLGRATAGPPHLFNQDAGTVHGDATAL
jgi:hypothetical protein